MTQFPWLLLLIQICIVTKGQVDKTCHTMLNFGDAPHRRDSSGALIEAYPDGKWEYVKGGFKGPSYYKHERHGYTLVYDATEERWNANDKEGDTFMYCTQEHLWDCWQNNWFYLNDEGIWDGPHKQGDIVPWCYDRSIDCDNSGLYGDAICISNVVEGMNVTQWSLYSDGCVNSMPIYYYYDHKIDGDGEEDTYNLYYCDYVDSQDQWIIVKNEQKLAMCKSVDLMECGHGSWYEYEIDGGEDGENALYFEISVNDKDQCESSSEDLSSDTDEVSATLTPGTIIGLGILVMVMVTFAAVCIWTRSSAKVEKNEVNSFMTSINPSYQVESY